MSSFQIRQISTQDAFRGLNETLSCLSKTNLTDIMLCDAVYIRLHTHKTFVADYGGSVVGTASILLERKLIHGGGLVAHLEDVVVHKDFQRQGIGRALVEKCVAEALALGCYKIILNCSEQNIPFYQSLGFRTHEMGMRLDFGR